MANATYGTDTIHFAAELAGRTIRLTSGDLRITDDLEIRGLGAEQLTISGNQASRIFTVDNAAPTAVTVAIRDLSLVDGNSSAYPYGGAIYNQELLTVEDCILSDNRAVYGGGIRNDGRLTVTNVSLENNSANSYGGGIQNDGSLDIMNSRLTNNRTDHRGGGIRNDGMLSIVNSLLNGNIALHSGGAIYNASGTLSIGNSRLANNVAVYGGAIRNDSVLIVTSSMLVDNLARNTQFSAGVGGAIFSFDTATLVNSTLAGNRAHSGAGIAFDGFQSGTLTISNSTLADNVANYAGGGIFYDGGLEGGSTLTIVNSTVANNSAGSYGGGIENFGGALTIINSLATGNSALHGPDIDGFGTVSARNNIIQDGANAGIVHGVDGNQVGVDPMLDPAGLQDVGGPTQMIALLPGSPAINAGDDAAAAGLATDQRGLPFVRIDGSAVDVGAYEAQLAPIDFNPNGLAETSDIDVLVAVIVGGEDPWEFDLTGDLLVDYRDLHVWLKLAGLMSLPSRQPYSVGDSNLDGVVDTQDFNAWNEDRFTATAAWSSADFNADGVTDGSDFNLWLVNRFLTAAGESASAARGQGPQRTPRSALPIAADRRALAVDAIMAYSTTVGYQSQNASVTAATAIADDESHTMNDADPNRADCALATLGRYVLSRHGVWRSVMLIDESVAESDGTQTDRPESAVSSLLRFVVRTHSPGIYSWRS